MISNFNSKAWTYLILPLTRHYFTICTRNLDSWVQTCSVVRIADNSSKTSCRSGGAVIRTLRTGVSSFGPTKRPFVEWRSYFEESVFLLNSKPRFEVFYFLHDLVWEISEICIHWNDCVFESIDSEGFTKYKNVVAFPERIWIECNWLYYNFWISSLSLASWGSVIIPFREVCKSIDFLLKSSLFRSCCKTTTVDPNVLSDDLSSLI